MRVSRVSLSLASILGLLAALVVASPAQALTASISGTVAVAGATPGTLAGIRVDVLTEHGINPTTTTFTAADGTYTIDSGIPAGNRLLVQFSGDHDGTPLATQWYEGAFYRGDATVFEPLGEGQVVSGVDALMDYAGEIKGTVTALAGGSLYVLVACYRVDDGGGEPAFITWVPTGGSYTISDLMPGSYIVRTGSHSSSLGQLNALYWTADGGARYLEDAEEIELAPGATVDGIDFALPERTFDVDRIAGDDRYQTAVAVTQTMFPDPGPGDDPLSVPVVYIASGSNFPDALAAGPAAMHGEGAVLLTPRDALPASVATELGRLNPQRIVVAGGTGAVGAGVFEALKQFVPSPPDVDRIGGADRYETSRLIVADAFAAGSAPAVIVATGRDFPDALAAGPSVGRVDAPVILIDGLVPDSVWHTFDLFDYLGTRSALLAGGESVITPETAQAVDNALGYLDPEGHANRYSWLTDRYDTAVGVNQWFPYDSEVAVLSSGLGFADAMSGGPLADLIGGPIYLSRQDCVPQATADALAANNIQRVILLGGPGALGEGVESVTVC
jgi:putative cell wall-binding protein